MKKKQTIEAPLDTGRAQFAYSMRSKIKRRRPITILLVEDDPSDVMLTEAALDETYIRYRICTVESGYDVVPYLKKEGKYADAPTPDLILLDLSLPKKDGFEVLSELTEVATFGGIPIIVLSGIEHRREQLLSYNVWLSDCVTKPCSSMKLLEAFGKLHSPAE